MFVQKGESVLFFKEFAFAFYFNITCSFTLGCTRDANASHAFELHPQENDACCVLTALLIAVVECGYVIFCIIWFWFARPQIRAIILKIFVDRLKGKFSEMNVFPISLVTLCEYACNCFLLAVSIIRYERSVTFYVHMRL